MKVWSALLVAMSMTAFGAPGAPSDGRSPEELAHNAARVEYFSGHPEPGGKLLAALLCECTSEQQSAYTDRLLAHPPADPIQLRALIGSLTKLLKDSPERIAGVREQLLIRLQHLDPDHVNSWLIALPDPRVAEHQIHAERALANAARSPELRSDFMSNIRWIRALLEEAPPPPVSAELLEDLEGVEVRDIEAVGITAALVPNYSFLHRWCERDIPGIKEDCRTLGRRLMTGGGTLLERQIGASLVTKLARGESARDLADQKEVAQQRARFSWYAKYALDCAAADAGVMLKAYAEPDASEIASIEAIMLSRGLPLEPPTPLPSEPLCASKSPEPASSNR